MPKPSSFHFLGFIYEFFLLSMGHNIQEFINKFNTDKLTIKGS